MSTEEAVKPKPVLNRNVPNWGLTLAAILVAVGLGVGVFWVVNDGFQTPAQKEYYWQHTGYPMKMARKGQLQDLLNENERRKKTGEPQLVPPPIHIPDHSSAALQRSAAELRAALAKQRGATPL
jgi:hypothetical protein